MTHAATLISACLLVMHAAICDAQSAISDVNVGSRRRVAATLDDGQTRLIAASDTGGMRFTKPIPVPAAVPGRNPYIGAQFGYSLNGTGGAASNLIATGTIMYNVIAPDPKDASKAKFFLPIRGNLAGIGTADTVARNKTVQKLLSSVEGIRIGAEPYLLLPDIGQSVHPVLFGSAAWKINSGKDKTDTTRYVTAGRVSVGGELGLGASDGSKLPITVDVAWVWTAFADRNYKALLGADFPRSLQSGEFTVVLPIAANTGLLSEAVFGQRALPVWRIGVVLVAQGAK